MTGRENDIFRGSARPVRWWRGDLVVQQAPSTFWLTQWQGFVGIFSLICLVTLLFQYAASERSHSLPSESLQKERWIQVCWKSLRHCFAVMQTWPHYHDYHRLTSFIAFSVFQDKRASWDWNKGEYREKERICQARIVWKGPKVEKEV